MGDWPTRANEASISSCVRFFDRRKDSFCSSGADDTEGSWRTVTSNELRPQYRAVIYLQVTAPSIRSSRTILTKSSPGDGGMLPLHTSHTFHIRRVSRPTSSCVEFLDLIKYLRPPSHPDGHVSASAHELEPPPGCRAGPPVAPASWHCLPRQHGQTESRPEFQLILDDLHFESPLLSSL